MDHDENETKNAAVRQLLELADRGGLATPTEFTYFICSFAYMIFNHIVANCDLKRKFLSCEDHNAVFIKTVTVLIGTKYSDTGINSFISITCDKNHIVFGRILQKLFHCFIKNVKKI